MKGSPQATPPPQTPHDPWFIAFDVQGVNLAAIEEATGGRLVVEDTGVVHVYAPTAAQYEHAVMAVQEVEGRSIRKGELYR